MRDVVALWHKAGLPIVGEKRVATKLKETVNRYNAERKRAKNREGKIEKEWLEKLFDLCRCKCAIADTPIAQHKKVRCSCIAENRIPEAEACFLKDQRGERNRHISKVNISYGRVKNEKAKHRRKLVDEIAEQPSTSGVNLSALQETESLLMPTKLRKRKFIPVYREDDVFNESDEEYKPSENTGGKKYESLCMLC